MKHSRGHESFCSTGIVVNETSGEIECAIEDESFTNLSKRLDEVTSREPSINSVEEPDRTSALEEDIVPRQDRGRRLTCIILGAAVLLGAIGIIIIFADIKRGRIARHASGAGAGGNGPSWKSDSDSSPDFVDITSTDSLHDAMVVPSASPELSEVPIPSTTVDSSEPIIFYVMGDIPYDAEQKIKLQNQLDELDSDAKFVIHLGDITRATDSLCAEDELRSVHYILMKAPVPLKIIPGDNDWHKCPSREDSWKLWYELFYRFEGNWNHDLPIVEQESRKENFAFYYHQVLFIGVHLVGGYLVGGENNNGYGISFEEEEYAALEEEWYQRMDDCVTWTRQNIADHAGNDELRSVVIFGHAMRQGNTNVFFDELKNTISGLLPLTMPVYYIHGDGHSWSWDEPFNKVPNFVDVMVDNGNHSPPLKITLNGVESEPVFNFDRQGGRYN